MIFAHPGRTDSNGGHTNKKTGEYHYHNRPTDSVGDSQEKRCGIDFGAWMENDYENYLPYHIQMNQLKDDTQMLPFIELETTNCYIFMNDPIKIRGFVLDSDPFVIFEQFLLIFDEQDRITAYAFIYHPKDERIVKDWINKNYYDYYDTYVSIKYSDFKTENGPDLRIVSFKEER